MQKLTRENLYSLEEYARVRGEFRSRVLEHKQNRRLPLGENATLYFEDRLTMQYQIQEMLRAERIFEPEGIEDELNAYNPLIPDGSNWKATFMLEFPDVTVRVRKLEELVGIEDVVWLQVGELGKIRAIADEDLERSTEGKTSAVHFMRFELEPAQVDALRQGAPIAAGIDHPRYTVEVRPVPDNVRAALIADLD